MHQAIHATACSQSLQQQCRRSLQKKVHIDRYMAVRGGTEKHETSFRLNPAGHLEERLSGRKSTANAHKTEQCILQCLTRPLRHRLRQVHAPKVSRLDKMAVPAQSASLSRPGA